MNITEFVAQHAAVKPNADIAERWENRVVAEGLATRGRLGAEAYLARYGKGLKPPKAIALARMAEIKGATEMAARFWEEAYFLQTGLRESLTGTPVTAAIPTAAPDYATRAGFGSTPQLLVALTREEAMQMLRDPAYGIQEKIDGRRAMTRISHARVEAGNKRGLVGSLPLNICDGLAALKDAETDGEQVDEGNVHYLFDLLSLKGRDLRALPYAERHWALTQSISPTDSIRIVPLVQGSVEEKLRFIAELESRGAEGFVLKRLDAPYQPGEKHGAQWKYQFRGRLAVIAGERNGEKNSVEMFVLRADGSRRSMGFVTIPTSREIPPAGSIFEVEYLYCHPGEDGKLAQPVFKEMRDDAVEGECRDQKIKVKGMEARSDPRLAAVGKTLGLDTSPGTPAPTL